MCDLFVTLFVLLWLLYSLNSLALLIQNLILLLLLHLRDLPVQPAHIYENLDKEI